MNDAPPAPTSLSLLEDIVAPEPVSWWPLALGWWFVIAALVLAIGAAGWLALRRWQSNAYRRAALGELDALGDDAAGVPSLLKRVALARWPRAEVAALAGQPWISFLNESAPGSFDSQSADDLIAIDYMAIDLAADRNRQLIQGARHWISNHRSPST